MRKVLFWVSLVLIAESVFAAPSPQAMNHLNDQIKSLQALRSVQATAQIEEANLLYIRGKHAQDSELGLADFTRALKLSEEVLAQEPNNPAALVAWVASKGEVALAKGKLSALFDIPSLERAMIKLNQLNPRFENAASDRVLARLYHLAPALISIGSRSKAREHYLAALKIAPDFPGNQIFYAQFLMEDGQTEAAHELARKVKKSPDLGKFPYEQQEWLENADAILSEN